MSTFPQLGWGARAVSLGFYMCIDLQLLGEINIKLSLLLSCFSRVQPCATPWTAAYWDSLSMVSFLWCYLILPFSLSLWPCNCQLSSQSVSPTPSPAARALSQALQHCPALTSGSLLLRTARLLLPRLPCPLGRLSGHQALTRYTFQTSFPYGFLPRC